MSKNNNLSRHIPKENCDDRVFRCILLTINEQKLLTYNMCRIEENRFNKMIDILLDRGIVDLVDRTKSRYDTQNLVISDLVLAKNYIGNYKNSLKKIGVELIPLFLRLFIH